MLRVPDVANKPLPDEGVTGVLLSAAAAYPLAAILIVAIIICVAIWVPCWALVRWKQLDVLKSPEAGKAMIEVKKIENKHKRDMAKLKKEKKA